MTVLQIFTGMVVLLGSAEVFIHGAVSLAKILQLPPLVIGLTVIAFGISLPELVVSVVAAYRGHSDMAVGNVVVSNLFNILGITGLAAMVASLPVADKIMDFDIWVMLGATVLVLPILAGR